MVPDPQASAVVARADKVFDAGAQWESLWDVVYRYVAPGRANIFQKQRSPNDIQTDVFDSTAIEAAEALVNNIMTGMFPYWRSWFSLVPGPRIRRQAERDKLRPQLDAIRDYIHKYLLDRGFYNVVDAVILDRVVGGTGFLYVDEKQGDLDFACAALSDTRLTVDMYNKPACVVWKRGYSADALRLMWPGKVSKDLRSDPTYPAFDVYTLNEREPDGLWHCWTVLKTPATMLEHYVERHPRLYPTRWSTVPNWPYGRGPALLALSDIRALNKLKELTLLNAAKAVAGVYTAVDDGVLNPYTVSFAAGAVIPVATNDPNNPTLRELPTVARFDISQWSLENLENSIKSQFMTDQFGDLSRTPRSAQEIAERSGLIARRVGATLLRLRQEIVEPVLQRCLEIGAKRGLIPEIRLDGDTVAVAYEGELATAQRDVDAQKIVTFTGIAQQFGQVDPLAGFVVDIPAAMRRYAELTGVPEGILRSQKDAEALAQQTAEAAAQAASQVVQAQGEIAGVPRV